MFQKMGRMEAREGGDRMPTFLRTHPHSRDRRVRGGALVAVAPALLPGPGPAACRRAGRSPASPPTRLLAPSADPHPPSPRHMPCWRRVKAIEAMLPQAEGLYEMSGCEAARGALAGFRSVMQRLDWGA